MHELAITQSIVEAILGATGPRSSHRGAKVAGVHLEIGKLSGVVPDSVRFCFEVLAEGTTLAGARLDIDEPAGRGVCGDCGDEFELDCPILLCRCGSSRVVLVSGDELRILSVEVA